MTRILKFDTVDPVNVVIGEDAMGTGHPPHREGAATRLTEYSSGERALLSAIRVWFQGYPGTTAQLAPMREHLRRGAIADAGLLPLITFLGILSQNVRAPLTIHRVDCPTVGVDETALMAVLASRQRSDPGRAAHLLGRWLNPAACRHCAESAAAVATCLSLGQASPLIGMAVPEPQPARWPDVGRERVQY